MSDRTIKNARIKSTMLGREDHGILTFLLQLDYGGSGQGFGTYSLDEWDKKLERRVGVASSIELISEILAVVGVDTWEELPGKYIRADAEHVKIHGIGHVLEDRWLYPDRFFAGERYTP